MNTYKTRLKSFIGGLVIGLLAGGLVGWLLESIYIYNLITK